MVRDAPDRPAGARPVVPDDAHADVDPELVAVGVTRLRELVPVLAERDPQVEATVFAGYEQDVDGRPTRRLVESFPGDAPVVVAVPSVYAGAWANARDVVRLVAALASARRDEGPLDLGMDPVPLGRADEARPGVRWRRWRKWATDRAVDLTASTGWPTRASRRP